VSHFTASAYEGLANRIDESGRRLLIRILADAAVVRRYTAEQIVAEISLCLDHPRRYIELPLQRRK
jgi:hypothetical protein